ncbi:MAG: outer membrane beta-barrel protein [Thermoanaerobaculia bacterium]
MKKKLTTAVFALALTLPAIAQDWSLGVGSGAFVFGDFVERRLRPGNEQGPEDPHTLVLTAATRPGLSVDLERSFSERWAMRFEGTFTRAPLAVEVEGGNDDGAELDAGKLDVSTFMLPLVFRINPRGSFRFHLMAGPAYAIYRAEAQENVDDAEPAFEGTQGRFGVAFGGGVGWWMSDRFAVEGNITDIVTSSPFDRDDFADVPGIDIPRPHNVHTTVGVRWRF